MIKTVIFDIDNTMYSYSESNPKAMEALTSYVTSNLAVSREQFEEVYPKADRILKRRVQYDCAAIHNRLIRYQIILELLKKPLFPHALNMYHAYWDTLISCAEPEEGIRELMSELKAMGIRIGVGTDMTAYIQYKKLMALGVSSYIDFIVSSEEAGCEKPARKFYECCLEKAECEPQECAFVGDSLKKDALGAAAMGMNGIWYNFRREAFPEHPENCREIHQLMDLLNDHIIAK